MARPRTPTNVAKITGQHDKKPKRYGARSDPPVNPLGPAPADLSEEARTAWNEFAGEMPWLGASDRHIVKIAALLTERTRQPDCPLGFFAQLRLCLSSMGGTPVDRSRVTWDDDEKDDPAAEYFN